LAIYLTDNQTVSIRLICDYFFEGVGCIYYPPYPPGTKNPSYATECQIGVITIGIILATVLTYKLFVPVSDIAFSCVINGSNSLIELQFIYVLYLINFCTFYALCFTMLLVVDIKSESASAELQERVESNKQELDQYLGVYPYDRFLFMSYA